MDRYINVDGAWDEHLRNCRNYITSFLKGRKVHNLAVFGSGWLLDFPLEEASKGAEHIWLYDLVHPPQVIHKLRNFRNITTIQEDITGGALTGVFEAMQQYQKTGMRPDIVSICNTRFMPQTGFDHAVSLNVLSQLGDVLIDYISKFIALTSQEKDSILRILQQNHLDFISSGQACLITDTEEIWKKPGGTVAATKSLLKCSLPEGSSIEKWEWQFDPLGDYNPGYTTTSKVIAMQL